MTAEKTNPKTYKVVLEMTKDELVELHRYRRAQELEFGDSISVSEQAKQCIMTLLDTDMHQFDHHLERIDAELRSSQTPAFNRVTHELEMMGDQ